MDHHANDSELLARHREWIAAFDTTVDDDNWDRLRPWLTPDVRYVVSGSPFAMSLSGVDAVLAGLRQSIHNFDKRFDARHWTPVGTTILAPNTVQVRVWSHYEKAGLPPLSFPAMSQFSFRGEQIELMIDLYDDSLVELQEAYAWLAEHPGEFDPSYV